MAYAAELLVDHLHGSNGVTQKIRQAMYESAKQFVYIGFLLREVKEYGYYKEANFADVYEYAEFELGFKRSSVKNFIAIAENFGTQLDNFQGRRIETRTMFLQPKYEQFNYSQLVELLGMSEKQRAQAKPDMTVKQLRQLKKSDYTVYTTVNDETGKIEQTVQHHPQDPGQTSGLSHSLSWIDASQQTPDGTQSRKIVVVDYGSFRTIELGFYVAARKQWYILPRSAVKVLYWMDIPSYP